MILKHQLSWSDEYLQWLSGFANAQGGTLIIGLNDDGEGAGIQDAARLLEEILNKAKDLLGILVDVQVQADNEKEILEIKVTASLNPISYKGQYHYCNGSTIQELEGAALDRFLLKKQGKRWDGVSVPRATLADLSDQAFSLFREKVAMSKRLSKDSLAISNDKLLEKLRLVEGGNLKRAAILLFHPNPEAFFSGAYIKISFFSAHTELLFHDTIHGNFFEQVDKTMDLLLTKYRIGAYPVPEVALKAAVINAVINKDYGCGIPIQVSVYEDQFYVWSQSKQLNNRAVEKRHSTIYNPDVANAFFLTGYIDMWGQAMKTIIDECTKAGLTEPFFDYDTNGLMVEFKSQSLASPNITF